ncbi:OprD family porin [Pseudomonas lopnurensis]|uniref:OprD family porin n=1 Tax=Pseudomonas lopnurensis TaxID=1477517 RepID=UPI0028AC7DC2|nr:OprD family porin [Pseudomonas lopnurensis]
MNSLNLKTRTSAVSLAAAAALSSSQLFAGGFVEDSKAGLELRNFYFNRDFRSSNAAQSTAVEWAQGFMLRYESGFTEGPIGFGLDGLAYLGVKLDSGSGRSGTGLLPTGDSGDSADDYSKLGATAKVRVSDTVLRAGTLQPKLPVVQYSDLRLLPSVFQGAALTSTEWKDLTLDFGNLSRINKRDSTDFEKMVVTNGASRNITLRSSGIDADSFVYGGGTYKWNSGLTTSYHFGQLENFYKQHALGLAYTHPLGENSSLKADLRWARSTDDGNGVAGDGIDNNTLDGMLTYSLGHHAFSAAYQKMSGDTGYAYISGTNPYLVNFLVVGDYANKDENSWQLRYDYNFAGVGLPGLNFMTLYASGDNIDLGMAKEGKEWERNTVLSYVVQSGSLKNLGIKWVNAIYRNNFSSDYNDNRVVISYTLPLL